ncbi:exonuclease domain-containing protein [Paraglaciecola chathamensis]|uniref:exonuclease domain-containing protein n=1 Tax=Paraglaciecola chathamensis TaxID=368405 RepID=UPI002702D889|nr:exonuclease domain-containing protein [Paraglaciecola chathamensis]MDO6559471.1 exonuclease domain-containing protein [Paraglaciecola chathamensis]
MNDINKVSQDVTPSVKPANSVLVLSEKYYLDHFNEFITYTEVHCASLLASPHIEFIQRFKQLQHNTQCMFVRAVNRKGPFIACSKMLAYEEIENCQQQLDALLEIGALRHVEKSDVSLLLGTLNKAQLVELLCAQNVLFKKSAPKAELLRLAKALTPSAVIQHEVCDDIKVKTFVNEWQYLLFLFFGNLKSALDKFSMRDLGVLKTRSKSKQQGPRFDDIEQAQSAFYFAQLQQQLVQQQLATTSEQELLVLAQNQAVQQSPVGIIANEYAAHFWYEIGCALFALDNDSSKAQALAFWRLSSHQKAQERLIRETYKLDKAQAKSALEAILESPKDDELSLFAFDFYQRKFNQAKLSVRTQRLREHSTKLYIDEVYKDRVELGVKRYYETLSLPDEKCALGEKNAVYQSEYASERKEQPLQNARELQNGQQSVEHTRVSHTQVYRTENRLFRALFGLTFWHELFNEAQRATGSEFDRTPRLIKENSLYQELEEQVEARLALFTQHHPHATTSHAMGYITQVASHHYGQPNGIFRWHSKMLEIIGVFLQHVDGQCVACHLRAMAKNYQGLKDGYPDLMVIEHQQLRFEEVKAPGDQLRANQLVSIDALQNAGFNVGVCQVEWRYNPQQPYVVVDVETTGGCKPGHRITEIGAVKVINGRVVDSWSSLINPERRVPHFITRLTGISNDMVEDAPLFCEVIDDLECFMQDCIFVAHNVNFDYGFFKLEYARLERSFSMPKLCTVREMRKYYPGSKSYSLGNLTKEYGLSLDNHHRALCDAQAAAELLIMVNEKKRHA